MREAQGPAAAKAEEAAVTPFAAALDVWLADKKERVSGERYSITEARAGFWRTAFKGKRLGDITADDIRAYLRKRRAGAYGKRAGRKGAQRSAVTVNDDLSALRNFFGSAVKGGLLLSSPALAVDRYAGEIERKVRTLTEEEEKKLIQACREPYAVITKAGKRNLGGCRGGKTTKTKKPWTQGVKPPAYLAPLVTVALRSGLRRRTLLSIRWQDADLDGAQWNIPGEFVKTATAYRQPMAASVVEALRAHRGWLLEEDGAAAVAPEARIFQLDPGSSFKKAFQSACKRAGLPKLTFHGLRAAFLNRLRERGVAIDVAAELTGHRSLAVLLKHYREVPQTATRQAVAALDAKVNHG